MLRNLLLIILISSFFVGISSAQDERQMIQKLMSEGNLDYSIQFMPKPKPPPTKEEQEESVCTEGLSAEDVKLGKAIYKAMLLAGIFRQHNISDQGAIFLIIQYARWKYEQDKETMDFIDYLQNLIDEKFSCMDKWRKYYRAFLE